MQLKKYLVFLAIGTASGAFADARFTTDTAPVSEGSGLVYAQVQIDGLGQSDMRRMLFYADRATTALQDLVEGASNRDILDQDKANARFRTAISRLADAGTRTGLSMDQTADFFTQIIAAKFGAEFMQKVGALANGLDFRTLFRSVATVPDPRTTVNDEGSAFLNALAQASRDISLQTPQPDAAPTTSEPVVVAAEPVAPVVAAPAPRRPVPFPNANDVEIEIVDRVKVVNGQWQITIQTGDSLSTIAAAIYGNAQSFTVIYDANSTAIRNPNVVDIGTVLVLPRP